MTLDQIIATLDAAEKAATPGKWHRSRNWHIIAEGHDWDKCWLAPGITLENYDPSCDKRVAHINGPGSGNNASSDFDFIVLARNHMRTLIEAAKLNKRLIEFVRDCEEVMLDCDLAEGECQDEGPDFERCGPCEMYARRAALLADLKEAGDESERTSLAD